MKKGLSIIALAVIAFIICSYISLWSGNSEFQPIFLLHPPDPARADFRDYDSVTAAANLQYKGNALKRFMQGKQYREAWAAPIKAPVSFLDTLMGGMQVVEAGGGNQTHSLELESKEGTRFSLRSISKDPTPLVPDLALRLGLRNIVVDGVSAQHPYGALVAAALAEAAGVLHTHPRLLFVPAQKVLGPHNEKFGNRLYLLEYETEGEAKWTGVVGATEIVDTKDLQELKLAEGDSLSLAKEKLVRARLFDLLIGDWDRHPKQWGWVLQNNKSGMLAIPLPVDRDNAFFQLGGVLPSLIANRYLHPEISSFEEEIGYLPGLVSPFDVYFLSGIPKSVFVQQAQMLQTSLGDTVIAKAFENWPENIRQLDESEIRSILKVRRDALTEYAEQFHEIISEKEMLTEPLKGSEESEKARLLMSCFDCPPSS